eukprot:2414904-Rhodomonas_salina.1
MDRGLNEEEGRNSKEAHDWEGACELLVASSLKPPLRTNSPLNQPTLTPPRLTDDSPVPFPDYVPLPLVPPFSVVREAHHVQVPVPAT